MALTLETIVPWGRSYDEYSNMFGLTAVELGQRILGCADGPAAFNATCTQQGGKIISVDPLYAFTEGQIRSRIAETYDVIMAQLRLNQADYVWDELDSVDALGQVRMAAMQEFLADYETGRAAGRYVVGSLPQLPFADDQFDLALVSHLLFLYSEHLSADFHQQAIQELLRVAPEVRIFPLVTLAGAPSPYLTAVSAKLASAGHQIVIQRVNYEFQRGGNEMMIIHSSRSLSV